MYRFKLRNTNINMYSMLIIKTKNICIPNTLNAYEGDILILNTSFIEKY